MTIPALNQISAPGIQFDTTSPDATNAAGNTFWDTTNLTLATVLDATAGVTLQHGQEIHIRCTNKTLSNITNGMAVYISGAQGNHPKCAPALANDIATCQVVGVATQDIAVNATGYVTMIGDVHGVDTSVYSGDGKTLYLSATTPGLIVETAPSSPNYVVVIGTNQNTTNNGAITVNVYRPLATDTALGANIDYVAASQKAVKAYADTKLALTGGTLTGELTMPSGNVVASDARFSVKGGGSTNGFLMEQYTDKVCYLWNFENTSLTLGTNNQSRQTINADGSVDFHGNAVAMGAATFGGNIKVSNADGSIQVAGSKVGGNWWSWQTLDSDGRLRLVDVTSGTVPFSIAQGSGNATFGGALSAVGISSTVSSSGATATSLTLSNNGAGANTNTKLSFNAASTEYASIVAGYGASAPQMIFNLPVAGGGFSFTGGNVGIGAASTGAKLDVYDATAATVTARSGTRTLRFHALAGDWNYVQASGAPIIMGTSDSQPAYIYTNNVARMAIDSAGNVGVGTATPRTNFHISGVGDGSATVTTPYDVAFHHYYSTWGANADRVWLRKSWNATYADYLYMGSTGNSGNSSQAAIILSSGIPFSVGIGSDGGASLTSEFMRINSSGNVGIGTSSPSAKLDAVGTSVFGIYSSQRVWIESSGSTGNVYGAKAYMTQDLGANQGAFRIGTNYGLGAGNPNFTIDRSTTTQSYGSDPSALTYSTALTILGASGNVGIGTTSPQAKLEVSGGALKVGNTLGYGATFLNTSGSGMYVTFADQTNSSAIGTSAGDLILYNNSNTTERMRIDSSGNVGVGLTAPAVKLDVGGYIRASISGNNWGDNFGVTVQNSANTKTALTLWQEGYANAQIGSLAGDAKLYITNNYSGNGLGYAPASVVIDAVGRVGVGTTSPGVKMHVYDATGATFRLASGTRTLNVNAIASDWNYVQASGAPIIMGTSDSQPAYIYTNNTSRVTVDAAGNVGIGTTSPGVKLDVAGAITGSSDITSGANAGASTSFILNSAAGNNRYLIMKSAGIVRWGLRCNNSAESGSDAGSNFSLEAYGDAGAYIDSPISINRATGGAIAFTRPITSSGDISLKSASGNSPYLYFWSGGGYRHTIREVDGAAGYLNFNAVDATPFSFTGANVGIGTTSPTALLSLSSSSDYQLRLTRAGVKNFDLNVDSGGVFSIGDYTTRVLSVNGSNVGIGTTSPHAKLDVSRDVSASGGEQLWLTGTTNTGQQLRIGYNTTGDYGIIQAIKEGVAYEPIAINPYGGNVGIGTTSPNTKAEIYNLETVNRTTLTDILTINAAATTLPYAGHGGGILFRGQNYNVGNVAWARIGSIINDSSLNSNGASLVFDVSPTDSGTLSRAMTIRYDGNVGIGTASPSYSLEVAKAGDVAVGITATSTGSTSLNLYPTGGGLGQISVMGANVLALRTNNAERMRVDSTGNVGIGTTSPGGKLDVRGTIAWNDGNATLNAYNLGGSFNGAYAINVPAGSPFAFTNNTNFKVGIDASGNVGIGTTAPGYKLDVAGTGNFAGIAINNATNPTLDIVDGASLSSSESPRIRFRGASGSWFWIDNIGTALRFSSGASPGNNPMVLGDWGNVGIGTTSPSAKLHVNSDSSAIAQKWAYSADPVNYYMSFTPVDTGVNSVYWTMALYNAGSAASMTFRGANIGIGNTNPGYKLDVAGTGNFSGSLYGTSATFSSTIIASSANPEIRITDGGGASNEGILNFYSGATIKWQISNNDAGSSTYDFSIKERTNNTYKVQIGQGTSGNILLNQSGGSVGIGNTSPSYKLDVSGTGRFTSTLYASGGITGTGGSFSGQVTATDFYSSGNVSAYSDARLKTAIRPLETPLQKALALEPVRFLWTDGHGGEQVGLIAQQVRGVLPEVVTEHDGTLAVDYGKIVSVLLGAIQDQQSQIDELKTRLK